MLTALALFLAPATAVSLPQVPAFKGEKAVVYSADGPLFLATRDDALKLASNPDAKVFEQDLFGIKLRISPDGAPARWLACADLVATGPVCERRIRMRRGVVPPSMTEEMQALPTCPGDPRCPRN